MLLVLSSSDSPSKLSLRIFLQVLIDFNFEECSKSTERERVRVAPLSYNDWFGVTTNSQYFEPAATH
jgi:hypothetical protein